MTISVNSAAGAKGNEANFVTDANGNVVGLVGPSGGTEVGALVNSIRLRQKNVGIRIFDGRIAATHAVDGTSGTTYAATFTLAAVPDAIYPIYANGNTGSTITLNAVSACAVPDTDFNGNSQSLTVGSVATKNTIPVSPGTTQQGWLVGERILLDNPNGYNRVHIRAHVAAGAGTITIMGNGSNGSSDDFTNWATRSGLEHIFRQQTGNNTTTAGAFTSTTNVSYSPIVGLVYIARGRVFSVMVSGDSIDSGRGTYHSDSPVWQAIRSKARAGYAVEFANIGWAGSTTGNNRSNHLTAFAAGIVPDILIRPTTSPNDISTSIPDSMVKTWRQTAAIIFDDCRQYGVTFIPRTMCPANSNIDTPTGSENYGSDDAKRVAWNAEVLSWRENGVFVADWDSPVAAAAANANGQVPFASGMTTDSIHPNDTGNAAIAAQMLLDGVLP